MTKFRRLLGALVAVSAAAAGATATAAVPSPVSVRVYSTGVTAAEPTIGLHRDDVYVLGLRMPDTDPPTHRLVPVEPAVLRRAPGGHEWTDVAPRHATRHAHVTTADPYLYVDPRTGRVFSVDLTGFGCSMVSFSDDRGATWTANRLACGNDRGQNDDHETLFAGPPVTSKPVGYPHVVYYCAQDTVARGAYCAKSLDGGLTFALTRSPAFPQPRGQYSDHAHGVVGPDGTVYLPKADYRDLPHVAISRDEGDTWTHVQVATLPGDGSHESSVAVDANGRVHHLWMSRERLPYLVSSDDGGRTWGRPRPLGVKGLRAAALPSLDVTADGRIVLAFLGSTDAPVPFPPEDPCPLERRWTTGCAEPDAVARTTWHGYVGVQLGRGGPLHVVRVTPAGDPLIRGSCGPRRCKAVFDFIDVVADPSGAAWAAFVDACDRDTCRDVGRGLVVNVAPRPVRGRP